MAHWQKRWWENGQDFQLMGTWHVEIFSRQRAYPACFDHLCSPLCPPFPPQPHSLTDHFRNHPHCFLDSHLTFGVTGGWPSSVRHGRGACRVPEASNSTLMLSAFQMVAAASPCMCVCMCVQVHRGDGRRWQKRQRPPSFYSSAHTQLLCSAFSPRAHAHHTGLLLRGLRAAPQRGFFFFSMLHSSAGLQTKLTNPSATAFPLIQG